VRPQKSIRIWNDLYLIGGDRAYQGNVAEFIPGEAGYTPHWNVNVVHTAPGVTLASPYASAHYPEALFDDVEDPGDGASKLTPLRESVQSCSLDIRDRHGINNGLDRGRKVVCAPNPSRGPRG